MKLLEYWKRVAAVLLATGLAVGGVSCEEKPAEGAAQPDENGPEPAVVVREGGGEGQASEGATAGDEGSGTAVPETSGADENSESLPETAEESASPPNSGEALAPAPEENAEPAAKQPWTLAHAGFAAHLPPDVDLYLDARKLNWMWKLLAELKGQELLWDQLDEWMGEPSVREGYEEAVEELKVIVPLVLKDEVFLAARGVALPAAAAVEVSAAGSRTMGHDLTVALARGTSISS